MVSRVGMLLLALVFAAPAEARFLQADPAGVEGGINLYAFVANDPLNRVDPSGLQYIPPDRMVHILNAHGIDTPRTRPGNSVFNQEYTNPTALQQLSNDVFASPLAPPAVAPFGQGSVMVLQGQVMLLNQNTGQTIPYMIGTANGVPTNQVQIYYDNATGNVQTMFPVPISGGQGPQGSNSSPGLDVLPASASAPTGNLAGSDQNSFAPTAAGTASK
ncbi:hypothetical protein G8O24_33105 [Bradyrhizobium sp. INPA01-394B]|uniref:Uncharacterized protein n=1 Tax=Bradyrhizobium campsiandrae TaxID=1729892 RepID=A0ABR7ULN2_9BRAD|nr:RHS repeat-associated core domain-containing protein [Bradyrhizobium campsiandrae]MBC9882167.1 hypothetical protein [Bradyrhizobium campsiandrae]MBC9984344.1 hypothetical protein [Bradyrhizobium campsiandrae]